MSKVGCGADRRSRRMPPEADLALGRQVTCPIVKSDKLPNVTGQDGQGCKAGHGGAYSTVDGSLKGQTPRL